MESSDYDYRQLDDLIHSRIRLMIMSLLVSYSQADFTFLKEKTASTDGNISRHLTKLEEAGYIEVEKEFVDKKPRTSYRLTVKGREAMDHYVQTLTSIIQLGEEQ